MAGQQSGIRYHRLRAPRRDGEALVEPSPLQVGSLLQANQQAFVNAEEILIDGVPLAKLRSLAHSEIVTLAREHACAYRDLPTWPSGDLPIVLTGHQPALYHSGVWFKNFLADRLAQQAGGAAINVIIDNDVAPAPSIAALEQSSQGTRPARVAYDEPGPRVAWEMTWVESMETFRTFGNRLEKTIHPLIDRPAVSSFWPSAVEAAASGLPLGLAFSAARNRIEGELGLALLDVPLSQLCQTEWFCRAMAYILKEAPRFRGIYNQEVQAYRELHRIRSTSHPVPDLEKESTWTEVPFWIWTDKNPMRRRLWVSANYHQVQLSDQAGWEMSLSGGSDLIGDLQSVRSDGVYLRPRALSCTMILRLIASDLFIHGIGGAKYDQVTDEIIRQFFGMTPPQFVTATATALLPIERPQVDTADLAAIDGRLRDAVFNPERAVSEEMPSDVEWSQLIQRKRELLNYVPEFPEKHSWHRQLEEVNKELRVHITEPVARLRIERDQLASQLRQKQVLGSREFSWLLFPIERLRDLLLDLAVEAS
ncbi:hypothetical protein GC197_11445 [bacterium]|nr:hypothetical protein [bacterium]